jgi:hypothetical protein
MYPMYDKSNLFVLGPWTYPITELKGTDEILIEHQ